MIERQYANAVLPFFRTTAHSRTAAGQDPQWSRQATSPSLGVSEYLPRKSDCLKLECLTWLSASVVFIVCFVSGIFYTGDAESGEMASRGDELVFRLSINRPEGTPLYKRAALIYTEVFRRLNIKLLLEYHPLERSSIEVNEGRADGESARIHAYGKSFHNLIRVDETVFPMKVVAYKRDPSMPDLSGWESLRNSDYLVGYPRGMKACENNLLVNVKADRQAPGSSTYQGLRKLALGRMDYYVDDAHSIRPFLESSKYEWRGAVHFAGIMQEVPLYMYVHKKHKSLIPTLADTIRKIKSEGLIDRYDSLAFGIDGD
jgi:hypothetical protein